MLTNEQQSAVGELFTLALPAPLRHYLPDGSYLHVSSRYRIPESPLELLFELTERFWTQGRPDALLGQVDIVRTPADKTQGWFMASYGFRANPFLPCAPGRWGLEPWGARKGKGDDPLFSELYGPGLPERALELLVRQA